MRNASRFVYLAMMGIGCSGLPFSAIEIESHRCQHQTAERDQEIRRVVIGAFEQIHDGWSSDEVILQTELNRRFVDRCQQALPEVEASTFNWTLLNLRKAGKLKTETTRRDNRDSAPVLHVAEITARTMEDKHSLSTDRIMVNPKLRADFDQTAQRVVKGVDPYLVRKAAFRLRKTRQLRPELITRIADWDRQVTEHSAEELSRDNSQITDRPGIYIFRDNTGYLYIGEAASLRTRLKQHLDESDRKSLAAYLRSKGTSKITVEIHAFDPDSRAREVMVRRAYESELIRSRNPRFNVRP